MFYRQDSVAEIYLASKRGQHNTDDDFKLGEEFTLYILAVTVGLGEEGCSFWKKGLVQPNLALSYSMKA